MYFVRTESLHFGPVVPSYEAGSRYIDTDSDIDASIVIIDEVNSDDIVQIKDTKTEIPSTSLDTDFLMDQPNNGNKKNAEEIQLHSEPMNYSDDCNEQNEQENQLQSALTDQAVPDRFDCVSPPTEFLFQYLIVEPPQNEFMNPLKRARENKVYHQRLCLK